MLMRLVRSALAIVAMLSCVQVFAADTSPASAPRYTFSWPLDGSGLMPRGGTTKGPPVTLDQSASQAWQQLQKQDLSDFERDRRAILAMAGTYRVTFDFLEVTPFGAQDGAKAPYQSWGTEKVYVDSDTGESISLVHILEMRIVQPDGKVSEPLVTKHWRQDWTYHPMQIVEYKGNDRWQRRQLASAEGWGPRSWLQTVYQVDESPRYASLGGWEHTASFSSWRSLETWRPLPRREWSVRDDYQVLIGTNRHTIIPTGWVQEENNLKAVLTAERELDASHPYVAREYGVARYQRIRDADFAAADEYYERTKEFWNQVRDRWSKVFAERGSVTLKGPVDKLGLFQPLFAHADAIAEQGAAASKKNQEVIESALKEMGAVPGEEKRGN
jgi:hypothetical protein